MAAEFKDPKICANMMKIAEGYRRLAEHAGAIRIGDIRH